MSATCFGSQVELPRAVFTCNRSSSAAMARMAAALSIGNHGQHALGKSISVGLQRHRTSAGQILDISVAETLDHTACAAHPRLA